MTVTSHENQIAADRTVVDNVELEGFAASVTLDIHTREYRPANIFASIMQIYLTSPFYGPMMMSRLDTQTKGGLVMNEAETRYTEEEQAHLRGGHDVESDVECPTCKDVIAQGDVRTLALLVQDIDGYSVTPFVGELSDAVGTANGLKPGFPGSAVDVLESAGAGWHSSPEVGTCIECFDLFVQEEDMEEQLCPRHNYHEEES